MTTSHNNSPILACDNLYKQKDTNYFEGARYDFVAELPVNQNARILEVGCSNGNTGALALADKKCGEYIGIDINENAIEKARSKITKAIAGDIEAMHLPWAEEYFDVLILSEVLEHLSNPWATLKKLHPYLKPGAIILASLPNVSHYRIILMLLKGQWNLTDDGIMDRTHLRWFTPKTFAELFETNGYTVDKIEPLGSLKLNIKIKMAILLGKANHLFIKQMKIKAYKI